MLLLLSLAFACQDIDAKIESAASEFAASLTEAQRSTLVQPYEHAQRDQELFFPGKRPGLKIGALAEKPRALLEAAMKLFLSEEGWKLCEAIAAQGGGSRSLGDYWVTFFGAPGQGKPYAWRVAEHHLTVLHVTVDPKDPARFGPILLGANPPTLFKAHEDAALALWSALTEDERKACRRDGDGASGKAIGDGGLALADLPEDRRKLARALLDARLSLFSEGIRGKVGKILEGRALRLAFYGDPSKRASDGGRYDWKIGADDVLCDFQSSHGHIHTTVRAR